MVDFEAAHGAEAARNNEESMQRGGVTKAYNERRYGPVETPSPRRFPREGSIESHSDDEGDSDSEQNRDEPNWADPDIKGHFYGNR